MSVQPAAGAPGRKRKLQGDKLRQLAFAPSFIVYSLLLVKHDNTGTSSKTEEQLWRNYQHWHPLRITICLAMYTYGSREDPVQCMASNDAAIAWTLQQDEINRDQHGTGNLLHPSPRSSTFRCHSSVSPLTPIIMAIPLKATVASSAASHRL